MVQFCVGLDWFRSYKVENGLNKTNSKWKSRRANISVKYENDVKKYHNREKHYHNSKTKDARQLSLSWMRMTLWRAADININKTKQLGFTWTSKSRIDQIIHSEYNISLNWTITIFSTKLISRNCPLLNHTILLTASIPFYCSDTTFSGMKKRLRYQFRMLTTEYKGRPKP